MPGSPQKSDCANITLGGPPLSLSFPHQLGDPGQALWGLPEEQDLNTVSTKLRIARLGLVAGVELAWRGGVGGRL